MPRPLKSPHLRIIPLGGLGEIGRNMNVLEYVPAHGASEILIFDMGIGFPEENMPGVDYTIPNITYLQEARKQGKRILAVFFTHGHYDHIGAIPYLLPKLGFDIPLFASQLTKGIILKRQEDFPHQPKLKIQAVEHGDKFKMGSFIIETFRLNHNIPGDLGFFIETQLGNIMHVADFKFDANPVNDPPVDFEHLKALANQGVLLLLLDSTGAEEEGHSLSEKQIYQNLEKIFEGTRGRIFAGTFGSLLNRVQQLITLSEKYGRKVALEGYTMRTNVAIARELGYIKHKKGTVISSQEAAKLPDHSITVLGTGAQGEKEAALMRIAQGEHRHWHLKTGDTIIFSSSIVPGNERSVQYLKDQLYRRNVNVYHYKMMDIHAGGHAQREELAQMIKIARPKFFLPIHGQYSMLVNHVRLAQSLGIATKNTLVAENGQIVQVTPQSIGLSKQEAPANIVMVDGLGIGDVGEIVLRDRQMLAKDGMFVVIAVVDRKAGKVRGSPDIISRGFVYLRESKKLLKDARRRVSSIINKAAARGGAVNWAYVKDEIRNRLGEFLFAETERRPMVLPVIIEV